MSHYVKLVESLTNLLGFGFLETAKKHRQVMDIASPASLALERGLDQKAQMCVAQEDIEKYYDNLVVPQVARWLDRTLSASDLAATLVAMHSCPRISLKVAGEIATFSGWTVCMFTGAQADSLF